MRSLDTDFLCQHLYQMVKQGEAINMESDVGQKSLLRMKLPDAQSAEREGMLCLLCAPEYIGHRAELIVEIDSTVAKLPKLPY